MMCSPRSVCWPVVLLAAYRVVSADDLSALIEQRTQKIVGECAFTEGPAWHPDGYLLFSDIPNNRILRVNPDGQSGDWLNPSGGANGLVCDQQGHVYACQGALRRVVRLRTGDDGLGMLVDVLASEYQGHPFNQPNDLALDTAGGLYFTDPNYRPEGEPAKQPVQGVYYVSAGGEVSLVIDDLPRPNGILVSADGRTLYVANIELRQIMRYPIIGPGRVGAGEVLFTGEEERDGRGPDGMALDEHGNLYTTYKSLVVVRPDGSLVGRLDLPEKPSNCSFGGPDRTTLYVTARTSLYAVAAKVAGAPLPASGPIGAVSGTTREVRARDLVLQIPQRWKQTEPTLKLRITQFEVPPVEGDFEPGDLSVSGPIGGSVAANVDRWIQQFAPEGRTVQMAQGRCPQGDYVIVELSGTFKRPVGRPIEGRTEPAPNYRLLGAIITLGQQGNYFLKLTGPEATVADAADAFRASFGGRTDAESPYDLPNN